MIAVVPCLTVVVGLPGSGKSRHLRGLVEDGSIQEELGDFLERLIDLDLNIKALKASLKIGSRIGLGGRSFLETYRRRLLELGLENVPGLEIHWTYFEPDPKPCLENIIKDGLAGRGDPVERVRALLKMAEWRPPLLPRKVTVLPVVGQPVTGREVARFFRSVDFGEDRAEVERKVDRYLYPPDEG